MIKQPPAALAKLWSCPWWCFGFVRLPVLSPYSDQVISWPRWICADSCVCWQRCAETSQSSFQGNLCDSQYAIRTAGDSVLIWRRGLSCQGSCLWLVDDGRWHGKTDCQTLPILSVACYSVRSLLPLHSSTSLSRLFDDRTTLTPGLVQFLPAGHVGNLHIPRRASHRQKTTGELYALAPRTSKLQSWAACQTM